VFKLSLCQIKNDKYIFKQGNKHTNNNNNNFNIKIDIKLHKLFFSYLKKANINSKNKKIKDTSSGYFLSTVKTPITSKITLTKQKTKKKKKHTTSD